VASPRWAESVEAAAGDAYQASFYGLRPGVVLTLFIEKGLWQDYLRSRIETSSGTPPRIPKEGRHP
jgi:hypothetical protein